ncbi:MAG: hypothetical protein QOH47_848 [Sphingomonadales bacterium]|jgi:hypothetical protein|nr:hypothetical protein [Sphingomonadales bacterium]
MAGNPRSVRFKPSIPESIVLKKLAAGPVWVRSLGPWKVLADQLVTAGLVKRVSPQNGRGRNMMTLTDTGRSVVYRMEGPIEC